MSIPSSQGTDSFPTGANVKCDFDEDNPDLPCKRCVDKRYSCSEKLLGPKSLTIAENKQKELATLRSSVSRPIGTPADQLLLPNDMAYLQYYDVIFRTQFRRRPRDSKSIWLSSGSFSVLGSCIFRVPFHNVDFDLNSRPIRAAILALASLERHGERRDDADSYYTIYYRAASDAVARRDVTSLIYASYVMAIVNCLYEEHLPDVLVHCTQFCRAVRAAFEEDLLGEECSVMWQSVVLAVYERHWMGLYNGGPNIHPLWREPPGFHYSWSFSCSPATAKMRTPTDRWRKERLDALVEILTISSPLVSFQAGRSDVRVQLSTHLFYLQILYENFLFHANSVTESRVITKTPNPSRESLHAVLVQIIELIERLPTRCSLLDAWFRCYSTISTVTDLSDDASCEAADSISGLHSCEITMLYSSARMLIGLVRSDPDYREVCNSALATVRLIWSARSIISQRRSHVVAGSLFSGGTDHAILIRRSLFWAGLILYKGDDLRGNGYPSVESLTSPRETILRTMCHARRLLNQRY